MVGAVLREGKATVERSWWAQGAVDPSTVRRAGIVLTPVRAHGRSAVVISCRRCRLNRPVKRERLEEVLRQAAVEGRATIYVTSGGHLRNSVS